jgi:hypothetical protein
MACFCSSLGLRPRVVWVGIARGFGLWVKIAQVRFNDVLTGKAFSTSVVSLPEPLMEQVQTMVKHERELWTQAQSSKKSQVKAS